MMEMTVNKPDIRERTLEFGLGYPIDEELIMLILGSGNSKMPITVMARKIADVLDASNDDEVVDNLLKLNGVGKSKALAVAAALELGKRRYIHLGAHIKTPKDLIPFVRNYAINKKEYFLTITLNGGHNIIQIHVVSVGTINRTLIHPREVFVDAIKENASAVIFCHNHPSGNTKPSEDDIITTKTLLDASEIIGIKVLDHIIVDCNSYFSFLEHNLLFNADEDNNGSDN